MEYQPLTSSNINESIVLKEVMATHDPVNKDFNASYILYFAKKILFLIMMGGKAIYEDEESDDNELDNNTMSNVDESNLYQIKQLSFEIALRCSGNATDDQHSTVMHFLKMLSAYPWEAKLLMMLAAFSINFGELSLLQSHKGLPCKLAILKGITKTPLLAVAPSHIQQSISLFIKSLLLLTDTIVELAKSSTYNSSPIIPVASYWILISILILSSFLRHLLSGGSEWLNVEGATLLSNLTATINYLFSAYCRPVQEMKREEDSYNALWCAFSDENPIHPTNLDALKLIFNVKDVDKEKPLFDYMQDQTAGLRSLENKRLVLFITSDLEIDFSMFIVSGYFSNSARLWIPIVDYPTLRWDTETMNNHYRVLTNIAKMLGVKNLEKFIAPGFARFVKKKFFPTFQIGGGPITVLLDHHGRIVHCIATHMIVKRTVDFALKGGPAIRNKDSIIPLFKNALKETTSSVSHLMFDIDEKISDFANQIDSQLDEWLRGIQSEIQNSIESIVFKSVMEEDHWKEKTWCTKLLIGKTIFPVVEEWVNANEHIFFIGGNDINWIKTFAFKVLTEIHFIPQQTLNMVYVGSNNKVASLIRRDMICDTFKSIGEESAFWINLQGIFLSRIKFLDDVCCDEKTDEIVKGLKLLLAYEAKEIGVVGWALLCKGNKTVVYDLGDKMLAVMNEYAKWKESAIVKGFDQAFKDHHNEMFAGSTCTSQHHPCALECPSNSDIPENIKCPQCCHNMQKIVTFKCYHDYLCKEFSDGHED